MEQLLRYFIQETNESLASIRADLSDLKKFKVEMIASARLTAFIVSAICGLITLLSSLFLVYYTAHAGVR